MADHIAYSKSLVTQCLEGSPAFGPLPGVDDLAVFINDMITIIRRGGGAGMVGQDAQALPDLGRFDQAGQKTMLLIGLPHPWLPR